MDARQKPRALRSDYLICRRARGSVSAETCLLTADDAHSVLILRNWFSTSVCKLLDREKGLEALRAEGEIERVKVARLQEEVRKDGARCDYRVWVAILSRNAIIL